MELALANLNDPALQVHILQRQIQCLTDAKAGRVEKPDQVCSYDRSQATGRAESPSRGHNAADVTTGVDVGGRTGPPGREAGVDDAGVRIEIAQVTAEPAKNAKPVDPGIGTQVGYAFIPAFHHLPADGLPWLEFTHQKTIQAEEDFVAAKSTLASRIMRLPKSLKPGRQRAAEKARCHTL